jgi:tetratricopeptide (TPR) repeat protein
VGDAEEARRGWTAAAEAHGDFQGMQVRAFSEASLWSAVALGRLGRTGERDALLRALEAHAEALLRAPATVDYFATSLPAMLLFEDDLQARQAVAARTMLAEARLGLGDVEGARAHLDEALRLDPAHDPAVDLRRALDAGAP